MDSVTNLHASVGQGMTSNDAKVLSGSDTEDDFFSVKGDFSRSCSNASSRRDSFSGSSSVLCQDPFRSDQVDNRPKLFEFLQDECWSEEIASIHLSYVPSAVFTAPGIKDDRLKPKPTVLQLPPMEETSSIPGEELKLSDKIAGDHNRSLKNEKAATASRCCFPSLSPRRSPREGKKGNPPNRALRMTRNKERKRSDD